MADESKAKQENWWKRLSSAQRVSLIGIGGWFFTQSASYAFKVFADQVIKSPELAAFLNSLLALLADRLVLGAVAALAAVAFFPVLWRWLREANITINIGDPELWKMLRPNGLQFRGTWRPDGSTDVAVWAEIKNVSDKTRSVEIVGWRVEIDGQIPDRNEPLFFASALLKGESQFLRLPPVRVKNLCAGNTGFAEFAVVFAQEGYKPDSGFICRIKFEFEEYASALRIEGTHQLADVPQDRVELIYGSAKGTRRRADERNLNKPGVAKQPDSVIETKS